MTKTKRSEQVRCLGCGRWLKAKASVAARRGPKCLARYNAEMAKTLEMLAADLAANYTAEQVDKATGLIEDNAIVKRIERPTGRGVYLAVSSDGSQWYTTEAGRCTC